MKLDANSFIINGVKRNLYKTVRHVDNKPFTKEDLEQYDYNTLFYNIFLTRKNDNLVIVGPRMCNFKDLFYPFEIYFNNIKLNNFQLIENEPKIFVLKIKVDKGVLDNNLVKIILKNKIVKEFKIKKNKLKVGQNVLFTKQKNNKLNWIEDWINYYLKIGVNTIVIYDNNSDNQKELIQKYEKSENIFIIPYNFKFGMVYCHENKYLQSALMNDFLYQFCDNNYILNFDIDELLNVKHLKDILKPEINLFIPQKRVPVIEKLQQNYSFKDFKLCMKEKEFMANKYIVHSKDTIILGVHDNINNKNKNKITSKSLIFYHYTGITTNWKTYSNRLEIKAIDNNLLEKINI